jgi:hypothetical protein
MAPCIDVIRLCCVTQGRNWPEGGPDPQGRSGGPEICTNSIKKFLGVLRRTFGPRILGASIVWTPSHKIPDTPLVAYTATINKQRQQLLKRVYACGKIPHSSTSRSYSKMYARFVVFVPPPNYFRL